MIVSINVHVDAATKVSVEEAGTHASAVKIAAGSSFVYLYMHDKEAQEVAAALRIAVARFALGNFPGAPASDTVDADFEVVGELPEAPR